MTTTTCLDPLSIGGVLIDPPLVLAPMAGRSTHALRQLCLKGGACGLVTTALLSSRSMHYSSGRKRTFELFDWTPEEYPVAVQLYGAEPQEMVDAAVLNQLLASIDAVSGATYFHRVTANDSDADRDVLHRIHETLG